MGMRPMGVFHFTPIVLMAALVALPFIWLVMPRLLPDNSPETVHEHRKFYAVFRLDDRSTAAGKSLETLRTRLPEDVTLQTANTEFLAAGDRFGVVATHDALEEAMRVLGATAAPPWLMDRLQANYAATGQDLVVVELAVTADSGLIGRRVTSSGVAENYNIAILGIHVVPHTRQERIEAGANSEIAEGDILLATGSLADLQKLARAENLLMLEGSKEMPRTAKAPLALAIMAGAVVPASIGLVPIAISALAGAILMFVTGCVKFDRVGRALSAKVIVLIAASIAIGRIVLDSGAAEWLGQVIALGLQFLSPAGVLAAVMLFVTLLTNFASNATAAAVGTPIAFSLANELGIPVEPLVLAVLFGCNLCYATPIAYQTNMLIMSAGDYKFGDYTRTGVPLVAIMIGTLSALLVFWYGLH
jgi:di/tricarboxylate transporter